MVVDLLAACRRENPRERPKMAEICQILKDLNPESSLIGPALSHASRLSQQTSQASGSSYKVSGPLLEKD